MLQFNNIYEKFVKELEIYQSVLPALSEFQQEYYVKNVLTNIAPKFYGGFVNSGKDYTGNGILLLEDLRQFDYTVVEKCKGLSLECAKAVLRELAKFHAVPIAMKAQKPDIFSKKIKPHLDEIKLCQIQKDDDIKWFLTIFRDLVESIPETRQHADKFEEHMRKLFKHTIKIVEPFATLCHSDLWSNNILIKFNKDEPETIKIVDYQLLHYNSFAKDLIIFLSVCVESDVLLNHYDDLLNFYYKHFTCTLERYGVNSNQYTYDGMLNEIDRVAKSERVTMQCFLMLFPIYQDPKNAVDVDEFDIQSFIDNKPSEQHKERFKLLVQKYANHNWI